MTIWGEEKKRKPFSIKTKKIEWMLASGRNPYDSSGKLQFIKTSKCRQCGTPLTWGDRRYNFDHKDNNPSNNRQTNCYLVCRNCHGKATVIKKRKVGDLFGYHYETYKKKVGYKKPKKKPKETRKTKRVAIRNVFGDVVGYKTVKVRERKKKTPSKKKVTTKKRKKSTTGKKTTKKKTPKKRTTRKKK